MDGNQEPGRVRLVLTGWHFEGRHRRNRPPAGLEELIDMDGPWRELSKAESIYHDNQVGKPERKFVCKAEGSFLGLGGCEAIWDPDAAKLIRQGPYRATYNYVNPGPWTRPAGLFRNVGHLVFDVVPYWFGGTERGEETTFRQRLTGKK